MLNFNIYYKITLKTMPIKNFNDYITESTDLSVSKEIYNQIGHKAFYMMGAKDLVGDNNSLGFKIRGSKEYNFIKITLNGLDLYDVDFIKFNKNGIIKKDTVNDVYNDMLKDLISKKTGLYLSL